MTCGEGPNEAMNKLTSLLIFSLVAFGWKHAEAYINRQAVFQAGDSSCDKYKDGIEYSEWSEAELAANI